MYDAKDLVSMCRHNKSLKGVVFKDLSFAFQDCVDFEVIDLSGLSTVNTVNLESMFENNRVLKRVNLSSFYTSNVIYMSRMFGGCCKLEQLDLHNFNTSKVIDMSGMFCNCETLKELDLSNFDTSNVKYMSRMFSGCSNLTRLNISNFDVSKVVEIKDIFKGCVNLKDVTLGPKCQELEQYLPSKRLVDEDDLYNRCPTIYKRYHTKSECVEYMRSLM